MILPHTSADPAAAIAEMGIAPAMLAGAAEREAVFEAAVWKNLRWNFAGHFMHGMLGMTGFRLVMAPTFVPAYLYGLTGSDAMVGMGLALQQLGGIISSIVGASQIEHRQRLIPVAMVMGTLMRVQILGIALAGFILSGLDLFVTTVLFLFLLGLFTGPQMVAFQVLLAKTIPISRRGRLQAWRSMTGGGIAAIAAYLAGRHLVEPNVWGNGYATTLLVAFVLTSLGLMSMGFLLREPDLPSVRPQTPLFERLRDFPTLLRGDRSFFYFMIARTFAVSGRMAAPFYILFVSTNLELTGTNLGLLTLAFLGADTVTNLGWGYLADRSGFRATLVLALAVWIGATILLMSVDNVALIFVAFFGLGAAQSGYFMSSQTLVLEFGDRDDVPMRLAMSNTAEATMAALGPVVGGLIAASLGYLAVLASSMALMAVALFILLRFVEEPRNRAKSTAH